MFRHFLIACLAMTFTNVSTDQSALLALKAHITLDPSQVLAKNWSTATSVCKWFGVTCGSHHQRVIAIDLSNMGLRGNIPPHIGNLSFLASLNMSGNSLDGNLPKELACLPKLKIIDFSSNSFSGEIPSWFSHLSELQVLSLSHNSFGGFIPPSIGNLSRLVAMTLQFNSLRGKIPGEIGNIYSLKLLNMSSNQLTGPIPEEIGNLSNLCWLDMGNNDIMGFLPFTIFNIASLIQINMANNGLSGTLPANMCYNLSNPRELNLNRNKFSGRISKRLYECSELQILKLEENMFDGSIPAEIGNLTMLKGLFLGFNNLTGMIPEEICNLHKLEELNLRYNMLKGSIPVGIFNISKLRIISLTSNYLSGSLPFSMGYNLPNLEELGVSKNDLTGAIPDSLSNSSRLTVLSFLLNKFNGLIPNSLGELRRLEFLSLARNKLTSDSRLSFLTSLTKISHLRYLIVNDNPLSSILPASIGNLSASLEKIYATRCRIKGTIPNEIGNLSNLILLDLSENDLSGVVPTTIQGLKKMQMLSFSDNKIEGPFPETLCRLPNLGILQMSQTQTFGPIPECLGNVTSLREIYLDSNRLISNIPSSLWNLKDLLKLNLSSNTLNGSLSPDIGNLKSITLVDLSFNDFTGDIPSSIGELQNLFNLSLLHNRLQGPIPETIGNMLSLLFLDLSHNSLSGLIPKSLERLQSLEYLNLTFNDLRGEIPSGGPFKNFTAQSFMFNEGLCGDPRFFVPPCKSTRSMRGKVVKIALIVSGSATLILTMASTFMFIRYRMKAKKDGEVKEICMVGEYSTAPGRISYYDLLQGTNGYSERNLLGVGSFGSVYKAILRDGMTVAVKVFNLQVEDALKSFGAECEILRNLRHRNLTKIISSCSNQDYKGLVLEYMPKGSLETWLYSDNCFLDFMQRLDIMIDVACALEYLHHGYFTPVVHCDLKPSNVLLDEDMVAHVTDFGIGKMLAEEESFVHTKTLATLGYTAPEYGLEGLVSTKADIYSYGIMLMETFTRTKPNSEVFSDDFSLKNWVRNSIPYAINEVVDATLLKSEDEHFAAKLQCVSSIMELALNCSANSPLERFSMIDVVAALKRIKHQLRTSYTVYENLGNLGNPEDN